jgi:hypothetical protein
MGGAGSTILPFDPFNLEDGRRDRGHCNRATAQASFAASGFETATEHPDGDVELRLG